MELSVIQSKIYEIREIRVMLDFDLAELYEVPTKALKQAVKRNINRFPDDFMLELTKDEWKELVTTCDQIPEAMKHSYIPPFAFTEHGVTMLSSVLRSGIAVNISIQIVRAFIAVRQFMLSQSADNTGKLRYEVKELKEYIEEVFADYNDMHEDTRMQLDLINEALAELQTKHKYVNKPRNPVGYVKPKER
jgi:histidinol-phosphate/aromatic aminotransferase/cobyric acid decarboxylase-like protein